MDLIDTHCHLTHGRLRPQLWATIVGLATGIGMAIACTRYNSDGGCVLFIPGSLVFHHGVGFIASLATSLDRPDPLDTSPDRLRRYARFPAGLPPGFTGN